MKKMIFGLIATVMLSFVGNAQEISKTTKKVVLNTQIVSIVEASKTVYTKGMTYEDFVKNLLIPSPTIPSQDEFFRTVYKYINSNTASCDILKAEHPEYENYLKDLSNTKSEGKVAGPKKWWQILINAAINIGLDIVIPGNSIPDIDLFP